MALVGFQYEPVSLAVNEVCFEEEQDIPNANEKSIKSQSVTEWCRCGKWAVMHLYLKSTRKVLELLRSWNFEILSVIGYEIRW